MKERKNGGKVVTFRGFLSKLSRVFVACVATCLFVNTAFAACSSDEIDVLGDGTNCETAKFSVTTTSTTTSLKWTMTARGTFYADCGDGGTLTSDSGGVSGKTITRSSTSEATYTCTWGSAGAHTVKMGGTATGYNTSNYRSISFNKSSNGTQANVASINGSLGAMFPVVSGVIPRFNDTFSGCTGLTSIPNTLFDGINTSTVTNTSEMFLSTFFNCTGLTSIPNDLFDGIDLSSATDTSGMFNNTFAYCTGLTSIPNDLFDGLNTSSTTNTSNMFAFAFTGCTGLTSIPGDLFDDIDTSSATDTKSMFISTFYGCTGLTGIPAGLFSTIDTSSSTDTNSMFYGTFSGCTGLTGAIPGDLFDGIDTSSATNTSDMFNNTFAYCTGLTSIPGNLFEDIDTSSATNTNAMFRGTFYGCTGLTSIPAGLFNTINTSSSTNTNYMFAQTFRSCSNLTGYIPPTTFPSTVVPSSSNSSDMWYETFANTNLATSCPAGTGEYNTGFQNDWGSSNGNTPTNGTHRVSCEPCGTLPANATWTTGTCDWTCDGGYYSANGTSCTAVETGYYSPAGDNTRTACTNTKPANSSYSGSGGSTNSCPWACDGGYYSADSTSCTAVETGYYSPAGDNTRTACTNGPANSSYTGSGGATNSCPWACDANAFLDNGACPLCSTLSGGYNSSVAGATSDIQCYKACTTSSIANSATVTGNDYYGAGLDTCSASTCVAGYHTEHTDWNTLIGTGQATTYGATNNSGIKVSGTNTASLNQYGMAVNEPNGFVVDYGTKGYFVGHGRCSTQGGTANVTTATILTDETGQSDAGYCYCLLEGYTPSGGTRQNLSAYWVLRGSPGSTCANSCAMSCASAMRLTTASDLAFRSAILDAIISPTTCEATEYSITMGNYLPAASETPTTCTAGNFCPGLQNTVNYNATTPQGLTSCSTLSGGYTNSAAGARTETDCYKACTTSSVAHATAVTGNDYYGDATDTCAATTCENGYHADPIVLSTTIGTAAASDRGFIALNGDSSMTDNQDTYGLTENGEFAVDYGNAGVIRGRAQCSDQEGTNNNDTWTDPTVSTVLPNNAGKYCYCTVDSYTPVGGTAKALSAPWVFQKIASNGWPVYCARDCAFNCAYYLQAASATQLSFRSAMLGLVPSLASCEANTYTVTYTAGTGTGANQTQSVTYNTAFTTKPANTFTKANATFAGWSASAGSYPAAGTEYTYAQMSDITLTATWACDSGYINTGTACETEKFSVTTTNLTDSSASNRRIYFKLSAKGTFYVNCGDGGTLYGNAVTNNTITRTDTNSSIYYCQYATTGTKTIKFGGVADTGAAYNTNYATAAITFYDYSNNTADKIASVDGSLSALFPQRGTNEGEFPKFYQTFFHATNLTSIPGTLFSGLNPGSKAGYMFYGTFSGCSSLSEIPSGLFDSITTAAGLMFGSTFADCSSVTSIPNGFFSHITTIPNSINGLFEGAFSGCTNLKTIPANLFGGITSGSRSMFNSMFSGCSSLESIPANLFSGITTGWSSMFQNTFRNCTSLKSIPTGLFSNITSTDGNLFDSTFYGCTSLTSIPADLFSGITSLNAGSGVFANTFNGCTSLSGYIPPTAFAGLINAGSPKGTQTWENTFANTNLATSCESYNKPQFITGYEGTNAYTTWNGKVSCGCNVGYYGDGDTCTACTNKPANTAYISAWVSNNCPWACDTGYLRAGDACVEEKFSVTTTNFTTTGQTVYFKLAAKGTFYVNCGDGGKLRSGSTVISNNTITQTSTSSAMYNCYYTTTGTKTIKFGGVADTGVAYSTYTSDEATISFYNSTSSYNSADKIASVDGSLGALFPQNGTDNGQFPRFYLTFYNATNLTSIPGTLFSGLNPGANATYMFNQTFNGCSSLSSIPSGLFSSITTGASYMFYGTFSGCTSLQTVPSGLFNSITSVASNSWYVFAYTFSECTGLETIGGPLVGSISNTSLSQYMFQYMFYGCTSLETIPNNFFSSITVSGPYMFSGTFNGCTSLETIPGNIFNGITTGSHYMFQNTFNGCTALRAIPSGLFSNITTGAGAMFNGTFQNCTSLTAIPSDLFSGMTGVSDNRDYLFQNLFNGCTALSGYIPPTAFGGLIEAGSTTGTYMWYNAFANTNLATSCDSYNKPQFITGYEGSNAYNTWNGKVSCGCDVGYYGDGTTCTACTNKPANTAYTSAWISNNCRWACDSGYLRAGDTCVEEKFSVTTTNLTDSSASNRRVYFKLAAKGTFYVNCGDGGTLDQFINSGSSVSNGTITRTSVDGGTYYCQYATTGVKTIQFGGSADTGSAYNTNYNVAAISFYNSTSSYNSADKIASVDGSLGALFPQRGTSSGEFPRFYWTFYNATNLTSIPGTLFSGLNPGANATYMFNNTFYGCTALDTIPTGIFSNITTGATHMFSYTFNDCTSLQTLPSGLFSSITTGASSMFTSTFSGCSSLQTIPGNLFGGITTAASSMFDHTFSRCTSLKTIPSGLFSHITSMGLWSFNYTFYGCTSLQSLPADLFSGITNIDAGFKYTFSGCTSLSGYIPPTAFAGLIAAGSPNNVSGAWEGVFNNTNLATSCDSYNMPQFITGYEGTGNNSWNGKVSCGCNTGYYGNGGADCTACTNAPAHSTYTRAWVTNACPYVCDNGYHDDNNACVGNTITINWAGASAAAITANDAGTVTYGGDIRTPQSATSVPGKIFHGWRFHKPTP